MSNVIAFPSLIQRLVAEERRAAATGRSENSDELRGPAVVLPFRTRPLQLDQSGPLRPRLPSRRGNFGDPL